MSGPARSFFVHMQKTAGTALLRRLRHQFGTDAVYPQREEQGRAEVVLSVKRLQRRAAEMGDQLRVVTGHFPLATVDLLPGPFATFTVVRDPVERILSFLRHQIEVEPRFADATLEEVYADPVATGGLVANHMVRMLALEAGELVDQAALTAIDVGEARRETACHRLEHRIDVFGIQEEFDVFCSDLEGAFGWDLGPPVFMNRTRPVAASARLRDQIVADNPHDLAFYRFAVDLWSRRHPDASPLLDPTSSDCGGEAPVG